MATTASPGLDPTLLAQDIERHLFTHFLDRWFPACVSEEGGFHQNLAEDWSRLPGDERGVVFQARMTWTAARAYRHRPDRTEFKDWARHGVGFLVDKLWDSRHGGFFWSTTPEGSSGDGSGAFKRTYGQAFGIFALAQAAIALDDAEVAGSAMRAFRWVEEHAHDSVNGGWKEILQADGSPIATGDAEADVGDFGPLGRYGLKLQNTHLHVLEALAELQRAAPDPLVRTRLSEAVRIMLDHMYVEPGCFHGVFHPDWRPVPAAWSIAHDVEACHLLLDAETLIEAPDLREKVAKIIRHSLDRGYDWEYGGFFEAADATGPIWDRGKGWWNQFECLLGLAATLPFVEDRFRSRRAIAQLWDFIAKRQFDPVHGGVYAKLSQAGEVIGNRGKGHAWKAAYHETRAMIETASLLRKAAASSLLRENTS
ncbi:MAG: AGE family epimerase/isomerase [Armatimonadetes bacterium]|nr:AGE family epimerase/isomerase [Armatimonadota bacterium]